MTPSDTPEQSEFRQDALSGRWVVLAPERAKRPLGLSNVKPHVRVNVERAVCPFCPGSEAETPPEVYAAPGPASTPWQVRVFPNKFPAVRPIAPDTHGLTQRFDMRLLPGFGVHEVVIEGRAHETEPTALPDDVYTRVLIAYRERIKTLGADRRLDYVSVFKNVGAEAGASMAHLHSQLIASPFVPNDVREELAGAEREHKFSGWCAYCRMLVGTGGRKPPRFVAESSGFLVICPFAPRFAYEMWVLPKEHASHYETITDSQALDLARLLKRVLTALDAAAGMPAFNYFLHTAPLRTPPMPHYHWHLEITPRTARAAGYEFGTGVFINTVMPEKAAAELRAAVPAGL
jgi:UDPglucose--hexose-1-phosphate uridylyltransferase